MQVDAPTEDNDNAEEEPYIVENPTLVRMQAKYIQYIIYYVDPHKLFSKSFVNFFKNTLQQQFKFYIKQPIFFFRIWKYMPTVTLDLLNYTGLYILPTIAHY